MLDSHPNIARGPETRLLADSAHLTIGALGPPAAVRLPKGYWHAKVGALLDGFKTDYARSRGKSRWADKNPRYALSLDHILELFPDCQVVHVIRDGHGVVVSHRHRWGYCWP